MTIGPFNCTRGQLWRELAQLAPQVIDGNTRAAGIGCGIYMCRCTGRHSAAGSLGEPSHTDYITPPSHGLYNSAQLLVPQRKLLTHNTPRSCAAADARSLKVCVTVTCNVITTTKTTGSIKETIHRLDRQIEIETANHIAFNNI